MTLPDEDRMAAKLEEVNRLIADLQRRRQELLKTRENRAVAPAAPKKETVEVKTPSKPEKAPVLQARTADSPPSTKELEGILDSLPWKSFKKKEGEWAFLRDRDGRLIDELRSAKEFVDGVRKGGEVVVGKYRYQASEDKFLNRHYAGG